MVPFGAAAAREAAAQWGFDDQAELCLLCISENATYRVTDPATGRRGVLRLNRPGYHSRQSIESELAWTAALRREGIVRTPQSLLTRLGARVAVLPPASAARHAVMFTFAEGAEPAAVELRRLMPTIGEIAARLHTHSRRWSRPEGFTRFSWDLPAALGTVDGSGGEQGRWGDWRAGAAPDVATILEVAQRSVVAKLTEYGQSPERFGLIHGDLRAANLLVEAQPAGEETVTVIDFDDCGLSWYGYDIAASVSFLEHSGDLAELVSGLLDGYRRCAPIADADLDVLPSLVMLRRLQLLAWSASHAQTEMVRSLGPGFGTSTADVAEKYLSGSLLTGAC